MESTFYELEVGDVVLISQPDYGFEVQDIGKYAEVVAQGDYFGREGVKVKPYAGVFTTAQVGNGQVGVDNVVGYESFGAVPLVLLNTLDIERDTAVQTSPTKDTYTTDHYNLYYTLTDKDIEAGKIKVDAYWVAKQWKTGSRDDSGALWHSLKTIARFGEKNDKAREIKALYNQAKALARIYDVEL